MKLALVLLAVAIASTSASLLGAAPLLPKVNVAPAQVTVVRQPVTIQETYPVHRAVPVPTRAVAYSAPAILPTYAAVGWAQPALLGLPHAPLYAH